MRWVVDGMNVIGSRPDGWWRDRNGAAHRLSAQLQRFAVDKGEQVTVVFEGGTFPGLAEGHADGVEVLYARRHGRNAADDRIVELVASDADPQSMAVVTSDRELTRRVESQGAAVVTSGAWLRWTSDRGRPKPAKP